MNAPTPDYDGRIWSNLSVNDGPFVSHTDEDGYTYTTREMRRLTWREAFERAEAERIELTEYKNRWRDLDRCVHGRHEDDVCSGCGGPSQGNPRLAADRIIGYSLHAGPHLIPRRRDRLAADLRRAQGAVQENAIDRSERRVG